MLGWKAFAAGLSLPLAAAICKDAATGVSAAGTTQGTATELTAADSELTNAVKVYPPTGMKINALAANAPMLLATNTGCLYKCVSTTRVFGVLSA